MLLSSKSLALLSSSEVSDIETLFLTMEFFVRLVGFGFMLTFLPENEWFPEWATNDCEVFEIEFLDNNNQVKKWVWFIYF